ncbi:hypothetical protein KIN20_015416 [Parelaphostrongylus tenuis]|uniref:Uncharacterized protein n=1 Tax=Parelaphostrongylus tenuis TaxID=148309 RepID=A0AAD5MYF2_PARTN|nr:hypothetical protein KIN20_015416 [Parelaphostrongylus tenuis]
MKSQNLETVAHKNKQESSSILETITEVCYTQSKQLDTARGKLHGQLVSDEVIALEEVLKSAELELEQLRDAVNRRDTESNDERQRERSPPLESYSVIDGDMRAVFPVTLNLLVGGESHEPMQLFVHDAVNKKRQLSRMMKGREKDLRR